MKNKVVYLTFTGLALGTLLGGGKAFAQTSVSTGYIIDSYTAGLLACECAKDHPDGHGTLEIVKKSDDMRQKAWETNLASIAAQTTRPAAMAENEGRASRPNRSHLSRGPAGAK